MKLVICELKERSRYTSREAAFIVHALINQYGWRHIETTDLYYSDALLNLLLSAEFGELPEVILFWEGYYLLNARAAELASVKCRKYLLCDDLHGGEEYSEEAKHKAFRLFKTIISTYGYAFARFYPELGKTKRIVWVPHSASPDFMLSYNEQPENAIFLSGAVNHYYPLRLQVRDLHDRDAYPIVAHQHPGYGDFDYATNTSVGRAYARRINAYRAAFTDASQYGYLVAKYFEIPATGALLLADRAVSDPLRSLGFIDGAHYIGVSHGDLEEKIRYVLDKNNHDELDEIRRRGQALVWQRHKTDDRARLINEICVAQTS
jgi:hypothetical protein